MRAILIALVLFLAALGGTYGYNYQTKLIEADVSERVKERLQDLNAGAIKTHIDRRKVVLSGIVASEAERTELMAATRRLPSVDHVVDGLSVLSGQSHFNAIKLADGFIINGAVEDQAMHDALLAQATAVAEGELFENLEVTGRPVDWFDQALLGLEKLAPLKTGMLSLNSSGYALSGITSDDPRTVAQSLVDLRDWRISIGTDRDITALQADRAALKTALTSVQSELETLRRAQTKRDQTSPQITQEPDARLNKLTERVAFLEAELTQRNEAIVSLRGQIGDRDTALYGAQSEVDAAKAELALLRKSSDGDGLTANQCATQSEALLSGGQISFTTGTAELSAASLSLLERLTGLALICVGPGLQLEVGGHTDSKGAEAYNQELSEERAKSVRIFLIGRGVKSDNITAVGYGESEPIADNGSEDGRAANRRISFRWSTP